MATHSSILAWKIPWTEAPGRLQSIGSQKAGHLACMESEYMEPACRSRINSSNWTWNNRLAPSPERSTSSLCIVTLLI